MSSKPILLLLGAGANIGAAITKHFSSAGYSIALASRSTVPGPTASGHLGIRADLSDPSSIPSIFNQVHAHFGASPSCVIYNAANVTPPPDAANPLSLGTETLERDLRIMTVTPFAAAREAVKGFEGLGKAAGAKTFIYTGNILNQTVMPVPALMTLGVGKSAAAYWIGVVGMALEGKGFKFYYADQRTPEGQPMGTTPGAEAHAKFFVELAKGNADAPWDATFVEGKGYVDFSKGGA